MQMISTKIFETGERFMAIKEGELDISSVIYYIDARLQQVTILSVYTHPNWRNQGWATKLLKMLIVDLKRRGIETIILDDDSDNFRLKNNIYAKLGWRYLHNWGPEMVLSL